MTIFNRIPAALVGFWIAAVPAMAAELKPPLEALRHQNYSLIAAQRLEGPVTEGKIRVRVIERLQGDTTSPEEIDVIVQTGDAGRIQPGSQYLLFYSDVERVSLKVRKELRNPDRRRILHIAGADPAVFSDTPEMRALFSPGHAEIERSPEYREVVMQGMQSQDPDLVDLWSAEWAIRFTLFADIRPEDVGLLSDLIEDPLQRPSARSRIVQASSERLQPGNETWLTASVGEVLKQINPAQLTESTGLSQLIYASLRVSQEYPGSSNIPQLEKWLRSTPPLAENAALALRAISADLERESVELAIVDETVPQQTRVFLADHLRRLDLATMSVKQSQNNLE